MGKGVVRLADGAGRLLNPLEWATRGDRNLRRLETTGRAVEAIGNLASEVGWVTHADGNVATAEAPWDGVTGAARTQPSRATGRSSSAAAWSASAAR